jgi:hypothetical protein
VKTSQLFVLLSGSFVIVYVAALGVAAASA